ncbi:MAG: hypothetical protein WKF84_25615 [Pyrinomonadaceae bacterium]
MTKLQEKAEQQQDHAAGPPEVKADANLSIFHERLAATIQWFLDYDPRVAIVRHPFVEELFQWKQAQLGRENPQSYRFNTAEDRLAIGIFEAIRSNADERSLHTWIKDLLQALDDSSKINEEIADVYKLSTKEGASALTESGKIPTERERIFI